MPRRCSADAPRRSAVEGQFEKSANDEQQAYKAEHDRSDCGLDAHLSVSSPTWASTDPPSSDGLVAVKCNDHDAYGQQDHLEHARRLSVSRAVRSFGSRDYARHGSRLVDAEVVSDGVHVQEPKDEQRDGDHADECAHDQDEERKPVGREASCATCQPPWLCVPRKRFGSHLTGSYAGHALRLSLDIRVGASPVGLGVGPLSIGIATTSL
jgi:hypothetical protein